jgi:predicted RNase H-like HicB family nuclease
MADTLEDYLALDYTVLVRENESGGFFAEVAELPGCWADGATEQEARATLKEAMRLWIKTQLADGQPIPAPRNPAHISNAVCQWLTVDTSAIVNETSQRIFSDMMWTCDLAGRSSDFIAMPGKI